MLTHVRTRHTIAVVMADLPAGFAERARALAAGEMEPVAPRDSATVVPLRDGQAGIEAYLMRRTGSMAFAAGMYVFPGGSVDGRDADRIRWIGPPPAEWAGRLAADPPLVRALTCAAVRETFEETGVVLARRVDAEEPLSDTRSAGWEADRQALIDRRLTFADLLDRRGLALRADLLRPWAHWITPESEPKRFSTRFFVAALPASQRTRDVGGEADHCVWLSPAAALDALRRGELAMLPPTASVLDDLAAYADVRSVLAAAPARHIEPVLPRLVVGPYGPRLLMPGDEGY
jgi:8-oxo-dGTP pyrophosphatase MutT (NUDIX family)